MQKLLCVFVKELKVVVDLFMSVETIKHIGVVLLIYRLIKVAKETLVLVLNFVMRQVMIGT